MEVDASGDLREERERERESVADILGIRKKKLCELQGVAVTREDAYTTSRLGGGREGIPQKQT